MVVEKWKKIYNNRIYDIEVRHEDWWYQAFMYGEHITKADASLESLQDILYGNGCRKKTGKETYEAKNVKLVMDWQKIDWPWIISIIEKNKKLKELREAENGKK